MWIWRLVGDSRIPDGMAQIKREWSFADTLEAHLFLDALDTLKPTPE